MSPNKRSARILTATDGSDGAERAIDFAADLAKAVRGELLIVNVVSGIAAPLFRHLTSEQNAWLRETEGAVSAEILSKAGAHARSDGCHTVLLESVHGDFVEAIIKIARQKDADMIVVGKRGAGRVKGLLVGSVSQKLVSLAPVPVVVVP